MIVDNITHGTGQPEFNNWEHWFAWRPVKLMSGRLAWLKRIYRRSYLHNGDEDWMRRDKLVYQYGTVFDVIANPNNR